MFSQLRVLDASKMLRFIRVLLENFLITGVKAVAMPKLLVLFLSRDALFCFEYQSNSASIQQNASDALFV